MSGLALPWPGVRSPRLIQCPSADDLAAVRRPMRMGDGVFRERFRFVRALPWLGTAGPVVPPVPSAPQGANSAGSVFNYNVTYAVPSGTNLVLMVFLGCGTNLASPTMTYNGTSLTHHGATASGAAHHMFFLIDPTTGSHTLAVDHGGLQRRTCVTILTLSGAHQATPCGTFQDGAATSTSPNRTFPAGSNVLAVADMNCIGIPTVTTDAGTEQVQVTEAGNNSTQALATNPSSGFASAFTLSASQVWSVIGANVSPP